METPFSPDQTARQTPCLVGGVQNQTVRQTPCLVGIGQNQTVRLTTCLVAGRIALPRPDAYPGFEPGRNSPKPDSASDAVSGPGDAEPDSASDDVSGPNQTVRLTTCLVEGCIGMLYVRRIALLFDG